jgi:hypothetical protein
MKKGDKQYYHFLIAKEKKSNKPMTCIILFVPLLFLNLAKKTKHQSNIFCKTNKFHDFADHEISRSVISYE